ncbi:MAG: hypothetical protein Q7K65_04965, partial [Candidatus Buchananbacteria bacterium]|nr:hypothetical protein [Candidatus Buchananbacteria bacterium]
MRYLDELKKLNLPQNSFAIFGSGPMAIRNMREITDLDLIVKPDLWQRLKEKYSKHLVPRKNTGELRIGHISIFQNWLPWFDDVNALIDKADLIDGIRYVKLENVISWKKQMARKKDLQDIKTIQKKSAMKINPSIFREYDIRGKYPQEIDLKTAYALGRAFALSLKAKKIAVACDRRLESALIKPAFLLGVKETGCQIFDLGIDSTPAMFFAVYDKKLDGGVSLTASHNPLGYVGLKLCDKKGSLLGLNTGVAKIKQLAEKVVLSKSDVFKTAKTVKIDIAEHYYKLAEKITDFKKIRGFKIVLD